MSKGEIKGINYEDNKYEFIHSASTLTGSSGSPIILKGKESVIGIHKAGNEIKKENYGDFIGPIINIIGLPDDPVKVLAEWINSYLLSS